MRRRKINESLEDRDCCAVHIPRVCYLHGGVLVRSLSMRYDMDLGARGDP